MNLVKFSPILIAVVSYASFRAFVVPASTASKPIKEWSDYRRDKRKATPYEKLQIQMLVDIRDPIREEIRIYGSSIRKAFEKGEFDLLEREADRLRRTQEKFGEGSFKLEHFYEALTEVIDRTESRYQVDFARCQKWVTEYPDSLTPKLVLTDFYTDYAWDARGSGWSNTVTEEGWRLMKERLVKASQALASVTEVRKNDPQWFVLALRIGLGLNFDAAMMDKIVDAAIAAYPGYWPIDSARAHSLMPRWFGEDGDWERYAESVMDRPSGVGDEAYARIVMRLAGFHFDVFRETKASWPNTRKGLELMMERYPDSLEIQSFAAKLAALGCDFEFAKERFEDIGKHYHNSVWTDVDQFVMFRTAANRGRW